MKIQLLDSTLRDGAQSQNISFSVEDKINMARALASFGIDFIEAGNPFSNPKDTEFFDAALRLDLKGAKLVPFGSTCRKGADASQDASLAALLDTSCEYVSIFGKSSAMHVEKILETTPEENLRMISDSVSFLTSKGRKVLFDAEHFFDGMKQNPEYAIATIKAAASAGAYAVVLCDTNGGAFPDFVKIATEAAKESIPDSVILGIHCHDDCGLAVANSMAAVSAGAVHIQGTFIGIGERCGNANLSTLIGNLQLKGGYSLVPQESVGKLTDMALFSAETCNVKLPGFLPYVGSGAFSHKAGMHADGVLKARESFEHINPELVGNRRSIVLSELAGRQSLIEKISHFGIKLEKNSDEATAVMARLKELERRGYVFEAAHASFELMVLRELKMFTPFFEIEDYKLIESQTGGVNSPANAMVKVKVGDRYEITADEGQGPVNAIDKAVRKALEVFYPILSKMKLVDYKVRVIDSGASTAAITRVLIESSDGGHSWTTTGASEDIISASMTALIDSIEYMLHKNNVYNYMQ